MTRWYDETVRDTQANPFLPQHEGRHGFERIWLDDNGQPVAATPTHEGAVEALLATIECLISDERIVIAPLDPVTRAVLRVRLAQTPLGQPIEAYGRTYRIIDRRGANP